MDGLHSASTRCRRQRDLSVQRHQPRHTIRVGRRQALAAIERRDPPAPTRPGRHQPSVKRSWRAVVRNLEAAMDAEVRVSMEHTVPPRIEDSARHVHGREVAAEHDPGRTEHELHDRAQLVGITSTTVCQSIVYERGIGGSDERRDPGMCQGHLRAVHEGDQIPRRGVKPPSDGQHGVDYGSTPQLVQRARAGCGELRLGRGEHQRRRRGRRGYTCSRSPRARSRL